MLLLVCVSGALMSAYLLVLYCAFGPLNDVPQTATHALACFLNLGHLGASIIYYVYGKTAVAADVTYYVLLRIST